MIIKVQQTVRTNHRRPQVLAYNEDRSLMFVGDLTQDVAEVLGRRLKVFFYADIDDDGRFLLNEEAPWQHW